MRVDAVKHFPASFLGDILDGLVAKNIFPRMVVGEFFDYNAGTLNDWVNQVNASMDPVTQQNLDVRIFDFALRPSLKDACDVFGYDARNIFNSSMVDQVGTSPFSVVTFADNHDFDNEGNLIQNDPILANAYLLTNNQIGIPSIFYPEFFSDDSSKLRALMTAHKRYIFGADNRDYLNRFNTPYSANYISGGASSSLIFQLSNQSFLDNEVIVVINFSGDVLQVDHEINMTHLNQGDTLTDIFSVSPNAFAVVSGSNQIYLEVPPRSFAVWIEGNKSNELISLDPITTSIRDKIENPLQLEVYPQPVTGELHIKVNESRSSRLILQLMDLNGRIVREAAHTVSVGAAEIQMDISSQPSGMYVLRVNLGDTYAVRRLMKQ
ncbi:MAG: T9SS type A sorting domain-containing protein, partial [Bacteroidota bacterium]